MRAENHKHTITEEGKELIQDLCDAEGESKEFKELARKHDLKIFAGGSLGRRIVEFPDELISDLYYSDYEHDTFYVLKVCSSTCPEIRREVQVWNTARETGDEHFFAQVDAWDDESFRWLLMKRVTPISPHKGDTAYISNRQEYIHDEEAIQTLVEWLEEEGWSVDDAYENTGFHEEEERICLFDFGGVTHEDEHLSTSSNNE